MTERNIYDSLAEAHAAALSIAELTSGMRVSDLCPPLQDGLNDAVIFAFGCGIGLAGGIDKGNIVLRDNDSARMAEAYLYIHKLYRSPETRQIAADLFEILGTGPAQWA